MSKKELIAVLLATLSILFVLTYIIFSELSSKELSNSEIKNKEIDVVDKFVKKDFDESYSNYLNSVYYSSQSEVQDSLNIINNASSYDEAYSEVLSALSSIEIIKVNVSSSYSDILSNLKNCSKVVILLEAYKSKYESLSSNGISVKDKKAYFYKNNEIYSVYQIVVGRDNNSSMSSFEDTEKYLDVDSKIELYKNLTNVDEGLKSVRVSQKIIDISKSMSIDVIRKRKDFSNIEFLSIKDVGGNSSNFTRVLSYDERLYWSVEKVLQKLIKEYRLDEDESNLEKLYRLKIFVETDFVLFKKDGSFVSLFFDNDDLYINSYASVYGTAESTYSVPKDVREQITLQQIELSKELDKDIECAIRYFILKNIINANVSESYYSDEIKQELRLGGIK